MIILNNSTQHEIFLIVTFNTIMLATKLEKKRKKKTKPTNDASHRTTQSNAQCLSEKIPFELNDALLCCTNIYFFLTDEHRSV